ncbi:hypothetical protein U8V97_10295 [Priestia filamentosa]|uniref:hypothetical protein n=1 Tax=Priestia filamentosa TaxID=1402861 RepID=UPI002E232E0E|nr:hypothetical protein [Priestia filamentosa]
MVRRILFVTMLLLLAIFAIDQGLSEKNKLFLEKQIIAEAQESHIIDFDQAFDFKWDNLYVFPGNTSVKEINKTLGFAWPNASSTGISKSDSHQLIVFVKDNKVTRYAKVPSQYGTLTPTDDENVYKFT